jgi:hypothetical protein
MEYATYLRKREDVIPCLLQSRVDAGAKTPDVAGGTYGGVVAAQGGEECDVQGAVGGFDFLTDGEVVADRWRDVFVLVIQR